MKQWLFLAAILFVTFVFTQSHESSESCSEEVEDVNVRKKCPRHYHGFVRQPSDANNNTKYWCLRLIMTNVSLTVAQAETYCKREGSVLSIFASYDEQKYIVQRASKHLKHRNITEGSIWLGGSRIEECRTLNETAQLSAPCNDKSKVFTVTDPRTDPSYAWTQWYTTAPSWSYYPYRAEDFATYPVADSTTANCLQLWIARKISEKNGQLNAIHCNIAVPPYDYEQSLSTNRGYLCGRPPVLDFSH